MPATERRATFVDESFVSAHHPIRPDWGCVACAAPWPCPTRRGELAAEFRGANVNMKLYLAVYFLDACADLPEAEPGALHSRFLSWPAQTVTDGQMPLPAWLQ